MKNSLYRKETSDSPGIILDREKNIFEIFGKSLPENTGQFYAPVLQWLEEYVSNPNEETIFIFKLDYFNSSSVKKYIEIISLLEEIQRKGKSIKITWCYSNDDELIRERGEEIKDITDIPFELKSC